MVGNLWSLHSNQSVAISSRSVSRSQVVITLQNLTRVQVQGLHPFLLSETEVNHGFLEDGITITFTVAVSLKAEWPPRPQGI